MNLKKIYRMMFPQSLRNRGGVVRIKKKMYSEIKKGDLDKYRDEIDYLLSINISSAPMIPYPYIDEYKKIEVVVKTDEKYGLPYVYHKDKRLFFPRNVDAHKMIKAYRTLLAEQDEHSPHCYFSDFNRLQKNDILVDVGAAEGLISLDYVDKVSKIYLN